jgi:hypothetical protein
VTATETGVGTLYELTLSRGGGFLSFYIAEHEVPRVDAIWGEYIDAGKTRDRKIDIEASNGESVSFLLSDVITLENSTRDGRRRVRERTLAMREEKKEDGDFYE